ncbi:MAG: 16S rRNA (uracil(1498)-N(3))-methyltransferase [Bacteroidia bacterium]|nr:16S rRNA (uracil(1498)-N(3))-methyltransferase [Bacteroidia bacterium]
MHLFYTHTIVGNSHTFNEEESKHAVRVLRLAEGDEITLVDGRGGFYKAVLTNANAKHCSVTIIETKKEYGKSVFHLHIAVAPTKNIDRIEWFIEKATEIGINELTPVECNHSERRVLKTDRLEKILISAMKQSLKAYLPRLNEMISFEQFVGRPFNGQKFIAHCRSTSTLPHLKNSYTAGSNVLLLIGPEGDFSDNEITLALNNGFKEISLGSSRLRTETAALHACSIINVING